MASKPIDAAIGDDEPHLQIGEIAGRTGVTQRTLRFYEEKGLLRPPTRMEGGFRLYSEADIQRVERIKRLKQLLGFSLAEIKEMVEAEEVKLQLKAEYRPDSALPQKRAQLRKAIEVTERQHDLIGQKIEALTDMQSRLDERLVTFHGWMKHLEEQPESDTKQKVKAKV